MQVGGNSTGSAGKLDVRLWEEQELIWGLIKRNVVKTVAWEEPPGRQSLRGCEGPAFGPESASNTRGPECL